MLRAHNLQVATALRDVSFELQGGEMVALIGPPQSGKTLLLKTLAGLVALSAGGVVVREDIILPAVSERALQEWQRRVGMVFQNDALFDGMTVFDNVAFPLRRLGVKAAQIEARVEERLHQVHLWDAKDEWPQALSGGMKKRVGIARATIHKPMLALFDEPFAGLDPQTARAIMALIVELRAAYGMMAVVVSNDLPTMLPVCSRVMMMVNGEVIFTDEPAALATASRAEVVQFVTGADAGPL